MSVPVTGALRAWRIANPPAAPTFQGVASPDEGLAWINAHAEADLRDPRIDSNAFGLEVFEDGEWNEWYDAEGRDIDEYGEDRS